jgi:SH3 domain-containing YSC84-like protein 1
VGGAAVDLVMVVMNENGMQHLMSNKFKLGSDGVAAAGPLGREAALDARWEGNVEILAYVRSRGVLAGLDLRVLLSRLTKKELELSTEKEYQSIQF